MSTTTWRAPARAPKPVAPGPGLLEVLAPVLADSTGVAWTLAVERERIAGRSDIHLVRGEHPGHAPRRWVVKRPHPAWSQDDVDCPLTARQEFAVLERLDRHFRRVGLPYAVPRPVGHVPALDAMVMEFVAGSTVKDLLLYRRAVRPGRLLDGLAAAGTFLRLLHALEPLGSTTVSLRTEAEAVLEVAEDKLSPLGLVLPHGLRHTLENVPPTWVPARRVWLHGDFGPANVVLATDGTTVGLDAALSALGRPEEDLARFVALVSGVLRLSPEVVVPALGRVREEFEDRLLGSYYGPGEPPVLFELTYLHQLCRRWCRLRELVRQHERGTRARLKLAVIDQQVPMLMVRSETRLRRGLGG